MGCIYGCLPDNYNWNIIFRGYDRAIELELKYVSESLDGTYRLNPSNPSVMYWSGGGNPYWPQEREKIIIEQKNKMVQEALRNGVSRWINNAVKYLNSKDITNEYKEQFPQMYNYLTDRNNIPYESIQRIHYEIVETITKCEKSKEVIEKIKKIEDNEKELAKKIIENYKKRDYYCNNLFLEIEKSHTKSRELYEEYFTLKKFKRDYNKNNKLYDILYDNSNSKNIFLISNAHRIINMGSELKFLEYLTLEKIKYINNLIKKANPICIGEKIEINFEKILF